MTVDNPKNYGFAMPVSGLGVPQVGDLTVAAAPSAGQGLALDPVGKIPLSVLPATPVYDYVVVTSDVVSASTVGATPTDIVVGTSLAYTDGDYWVEFGCAQLDNTSGANATILVDIWDGSTRLQQIAKSLIPNANSVPVFVRSKVTLAAATRQIKIRAYHITGAYTFRAGNGVTGAAAPMFLRVVSV